MMRTMENFCRTTASVTTPTGNCWVAGPKLDGGCPYSGETGRSSSFGAGDCFAIVMSRRSRDLLAANKFDVRFCALIRGVICCNFPQSVVSVRWFRG